VPATQELIGNFGRDKYGQSLFVPDAGKQDSRGRLGSSARRVELLWDGLVAAIGLIARADPELLGIAGLSLAVSGVATALAALVGVPVGVALHLGRLPAALGLVEPDLARAMWADGADDGRVGYELARAAAQSVLVAVAAGFGRAISEVGASLMVGGNIVGQTRILTTAIALETGRGEFALAIALGIVLLLLALVVNAGLGLVAIPATYTWRR
jgi:tungstate transport system permease protein